jgi:hypothetical protein
MPERMFDLLQEIVPAKVSRFSKLSDDQVPSYGFVRYEMDLSDQYCLHYRNLTDPTGPCRRVVLDELDTLLEAARRQNLEMLDQKTFRTYCPRSSKYPTGYTVTIRLLEHLGIGKYVGRGLVLYE